MNSLGREIFLTHFDRSRTVGALLQHGFLNCCSLVIRISQVGRVRYMFFILLALSLTDMFSTALFSLIPDGTILSRRINGRIFENIYIILSQGRIIIRGSGWDFLFRYSLL